MHRAANVGDGASVLLEMSNTEAARRGSLFMARPIANHKGQVFGYLELLRPIGRNKRGLVVWEAICTYEGCGKLHHISSETLRKNVVSCGCYARKQHRRRYIAKYQ